MNAADFRNQLRTLWSRSQVPMNRDNVAAFTGVSGRKLDQVLAVLVERGELQVEASGGEMRWKVPGKVRPLDGPETLERFERLQAMRTEARARVRDGGAASSDEGEERALVRVDSGDDEEDERGGGAGRSILRAGAGAVKGALGLVSAAAAPLDRAGKGGGEKSLALSAGLSLLGPLGWLYAGSFREAVPASLVFLLVAWILPNPILWPLLWFVLPASALGGLVYGWQYNRKGHRTPIFLSSGDGEEDES